MSRFSNRVERLESAQQQRRNGGCVKCLLATLPIVQDRSESAPAACDGRPKSLRKLLTEMK